MTAKDTDGVCRGSLAFGKVFYLRLVNFFLFIIYNFLSFFLILLLLLLLQSLNFLKHKIYRSNR